MALLESPFFDVMLTGTFLIVVPDEIALPFAQKKLTRVRVTARFGKSKLSIHAALRPIHGRYQMMFGKRYQQALGIFPSDIFEIKLIEDDSKYGVEVPEEFQAVLEADPEGAARFEALSIGLKRGIIYYVARFKNSQTRIDKTLMVFNNLHRGITDKYEILKPHD